MQVIAPGGEGCRSTRRKECRAYLSDSVLARASWHLSLAVVSSPPRKPPYVCSVDVENGNAYLFSSESIVPRIWKMASLIGGAFLAFEKSFIILATGDYASGTLRSRRSLSLSLSGNYVAQTFFAVSVH